MDGRQLLERFDRAIAPVLGIAAAAVLFAMMALTCIDVIGRYFSPAPCSAGSSSPR